MESYDSKTLLEILHIIRSEVNNLQDSIDNYLEENEVSQELADELEELRKVFPSYSAFSEIIELVEDEEKSKNDN